MQDAFIERLIARHKQGLPGRDYQVRMSAMLKRHIFDAPPTARKAAVLMLLFPQNGEWHIVLTERTGNPKDPHSKQISFPGGSVETVDVDLEATALRETQEEIGVESSTIDVIGAMTDVYIPVSNFHVQPFLAWTSTPPQYKRQETEVKRVIETPIALLENVNNWKVKDIYISETYNLKDVPYFDVFGKSVWGATAMMLSELLELLRNLKRY
ncbi:MAG: CoA pyrophosphatase [Saprospiraceae bacterium]|nr:CoA pyrophosphatase [Saprospiraceae bacterium]